jgi:hypothetical protein
MRPNQTPPFLSLPLPSVFTSVLVACTSQTATNQPSAAELAFFAGAKKTGWKEWLKLD